MATEFTFEVLPFQQGYEIGVRVDDPTGVIEEYIVWDCLNITADNLTCIKANLLWMVEMVQMQQYDRGVYDEIDARRAEFDHNWDKDDHDPWVGQHDDIPF